MEQQDIVVIRNEKRVEMDQLYPLSIKILNLLSPMICRIEAHDPAEPEHPDFLWLRYTPDNPSTEGICLQVAPYPEDDVRCYVKYELMYNSGGTATNWSLDGSQEEILARLPAKLGL